MTVPRDGRVVIVGTGIAAASAAEALRKEGFAGSIVLIGSDPYAPYRRPMVSKELLTGASTPERALVKPASFWTEQSIDLRVSTNVAALDTHAATVELDDGGELAYDALILATGGRARRLDPMFASAHTLRGMHHVDPLRATIAGTRAVGHSPAVVVVGGGLVGMEVAASVTEMGAAVTVLEAGARVLERVLPEDISSAWERLHRSRGVAVHTGVRIVSAETEPDGRTRVGTEDGRHRVADAVVVAVGMTPNDELARSAGITVDHGIVVDEFCATSAPGVYAAGDAARFPNLVLGGSERIEHWNHAQAHGAAAAMSVLGSGKPYAEVPWCWTTQFGRNLQITGWPGRGTELIVHGDLDGTFTALSVAGDRLVGAIASGRPRELRAARTLIKDGPYPPRTVLADPGVDLADLATEPQRFAEHPSPLGR